MLYSAIQKVMDVAGGIEAPPWMSSESNSNTIWLIIICVGVFLAFCAIFIGLLVVFGKLAGKKVAKKADIEFRTKKCELCEMEYVKPLERKINLCDDCYRLYKAGGLVHCPKCGKWHVPNVKCKCENND